LCSGTTWFRLRIVLKIIFGVIFHKIEDYATGVYGTGNVFSAWINRTSDNIGLVYFTRTVDSGLTFSAFQQLNITPAYSGIGMVVDSHGVITVSWIASDITTGKDAILYSTSNDFGASFNTQRELVVASNAQQNIRRLFSLIAADGKIYRAWWQIDTASGQNSTAMIAIGNEDSSFFRTSAIVEFESLDSSNLPEIQLAVDKVNNVYAAIVTADNIVHLYRSSDGCVSFQEIAEPKNLGAVGPAAFTLNGNGGFILIYPGLVQYETIVDGETVFTTATEVFFVQSNE
jgi:hypothetical protein